MLFRSPRQLLRQVIGRARDAGFSACFAVEFEFFVFKETPETMRAKGYKNLTPLSPGMFGYSWLREGQNADFCHAILDQMAAFDIELEALHTETGPGVYEVAIRYDDALRMADKAAMFKTAMKQLAARYPWIDIDRAGIYGHSGGGYATAGAMFRYPDFFKVGVSQAGNHDNRLYEDDWGEKWQGLLKTNPDGTTNYDNQANQLQAKNLKGKLLLAHGTMDNNVPPVNTMLVVNELIKANKDFDLLLFPNRTHGFGNEPYMVRRRWDYFVRYLLGGVPPEGYELKPPAGGRGFGPPQ